MTEFNDWMVLICVFGLQMQLIYAFLYIERLRKRTWLLAFALRNLAARMGVKLKFEFDDDFPDPVVRNNQTESE